MSKFMDEFKEFINRGNVMDMAVGVIVGGAFTSIVNSLVDDIINPLINVITGGNGTDFGALNVMGVNFGNFIGAVINFLIVAFIVFTIVKSLNKLNEAEAKLLHKEKEEEKPKPVCPHCLEEVKEGATRCPHCGGEIEA